MRPLKTSQTIAYFVAFIALGLTTASLGPTLPGLAGQTGVTIRDISYLFTARSFGFMVGSFGGGRLYDRLRGHAVMAAMLAMMAVIMAAAPLTATLAVLLAVMLLLGAAEGLMDVGANTLLVWVHGDRVAPFMNGLHFFYGVGAFLCPILLAQTLPLDGGVAVSYWLLAILTLPSAALLLRLPSPQNHPLAAEDSGAGGVDYKLVVLIALLLCLYVGAEVSYGSWIFSYVEAMNLGGKSVGAYVTSAFWGALTIGRLLGVPLAARFRPRAILFADLAGCFLSVLVGILWSTSLTAMTLATVGLGLSMASIYPAALTLTQKRIRITGRVTGFLVVGGSTGGMLLPWLIGQMFERLGARVMLFAVLVDLIGAVIVLLALIADANRHEKRLPVKQAAGEL